MQAYACGTSDDDCLRPGFLQQKKGRNAWLSALRRPAPDVTSHSQALTGRISVANAIADHDALTVTPNSADDRAASPVPRPGPGASIFAAVS
jgi:hypothetical protein